MIFRLERSFDERRTGRTFYIQVLLDNTATAPTYSPALFAFVIIAGVRHENSLQTTHTHNHLQYKTILILYTDILAVVSMSRTRFSYMYILHTCMLLN